jgi:hypothetical protein
MQPCSLPSHLRTAQYRAEFLHQRFTVIDDVFGPQACMDLVQRAVDFIATKQCPLMEKSADPNAEKFTLGEHKFHLFPINLVRKLFPEMEWVYHAWLPWLADLTAQDVIASPYQDEGVNYINAKYYGPGGSFDWHYDSQGLTCLIYTTDTVDDGPLILRPDTVLRGELVEPREVEIQPRAGRVVLMQGRNVRHIAKAMTTNQPRMMFSFNYFVHDLDRRSEATRLHGYDWPVTLGRLTADAIDRAKT